MDPKLDTVAAVIAAVAYARTLSPKIDGWRVLPLTLLFALIVAFAFAPDGPVNLIVLLGIVKGGLRLGLSAAGGMTGIGYGSAKLGEGVAKAMAEASAKLTALAEPVRMITIAGTDQRDEAVAASTPLPSPPRPEAPTNPEGLRR
jgi:hypothetical protein